MPASVRICSSIWQNSTILHVIDPSAGGRPREWSNGARGKPPTCGVSFRGRSSPTRLTGISTSQGGAGKRSTLKDVCALAAGGARGVHSCER